MPAQISAMSALPSRCGPPSSELQGPHPEHIADATSPASCKSRGVSADRIKLARPPCVLKAFDEAGFSGYWTNDKVLLVLFFGDKDAATIDDKDAAAAHSA